MFVWCKQIYYHEKFFQSKHMLNNLALRQGDVPVKETFVGYEHKEFLNSRIGDMFDFENTLPTTVRISDNAIDCINILKDDEQCHEGALVTSRNKYVGVITGRELTAGLLSLGVKKFVERPVGDYFSSNYNALTEDTTLGFYSKDTTIKKGFWIGNER